MPPNYHGHGRGGGGSGRKGLVFLELFWRLWGIGGKMCCQIEVANALVKNKGTYSFTLLGQAFDEHTRSLQFFL